ncbi:MAG: deoxyribonuclease IV [Mariniblastus sp.]|nr:deoxyribonuclease IV [Mariniblastus sp.]
MPILGAHMSIAGGYWKAVEAAAAVDGDCVQVFTKNNNRWQGKPLLDEECVRFQAALEEHAIQHTLSHASYLINLASNKPDLLAKSIDAMVDELQRADRLGIPYVVFHPGSHTTSTPEEGLATIADSLKTILARTDDLTTYPLLENTAGQGSNLGFEFEQLSFLIDEVGQAERLGVCIDTCHTFAAGYSMANSQDYETTIQQMETTFGIAQIKAIHLNDSKRPFASRKDRHEHIGQGEMGDEPFRFLMNDTRFASIPMYLETEKGEIDGIDMDQMNLDKLRSLVG